MLNCNIYIYLLHKKVMTTAYNQLKKKFVEFHLNTRQLLNSMIFISVNFLIIFLAKQQRIGNRGTKLLP